MKEVTKVLSSDVHEIERDGRTVKIQFVPQIVSTLRLDLVFWSQLQSPTKQIGLMSENISG